MKKSTIKRRLRLVKFVLKHRQYLKDLFRRNGNHYSGYKKPGSNDMLLMARKEIGYSPKTYDGDIYQTIARYNKKVNELFPYRRD